jgi:membrane fusion protein (multidrug efflux system)
VGADGKVVQKRVQIASAQENRWVITGGVADGDQIIVSGLQQAHPGAPAKAVAAKASQPNAPAPAAAPASGAH